MVVDDVDQLTPLVHAGTNVVLLVDPSEPHVPIPEGAGRVAVLVGSLSDPAVRSAAYEMDKELFGSPERRSPRSGGSRTTR